MADEVAESISTVFSRAEENYRKIVNYEIKPGAKEYNVGFTRGYIVSDALLFFLLMVIIIISLVIVDKVIITEFQIRILE